VRFGNTFFDRETVANLRSVGIIAGEISDGHWRLSGNGRRVDYWPTSGSCYEPNPPKGKTRIAGKKRGLQFVVDALSKEPGLVQVEIPIRTVESTPFGTVTEVCDMEDATRLDIVYCESREVRK
jgi:hypothetical protein